MIKTISPLDHYRPFFGKLAQYHSDTIYSSSFKISFCFQIQSAFTKPCSASYHRQGPLPNGRAACSFATSLASISHISSVAADMRCVQSRTFSSTTSRRASIGHGAFASLCQHTSNYCNSCQAHLLTYLPAASGFQRIVAAAHLYSARGFITGRCGRKCFFRASRSAWWAPNSRVPVPDVIRSPAG